MTNATGYPALAVDVGSVRVGVAISDALGIIAEPYGALPASPRTALIESLGRLCDERHIESVVVGLPRRARGDEGPAALAAREMADLLAQRVGCPVVLWDERFTTVAAERSLVEAGVSRARRRRSVDAVAASLILSSWLQSQQGSVMPKGGL